MTKQELHKIIKKNVEEIWYNRRSINPVERQINDLTDLLYKEINLKSHNDMFLKELRFRRSLHHDLLRECKDKKSEIIIKTRINECGQIIQLYNDIKKEIDESISKPKCPICKGPIIEVCWDCTDKLCKPLKDWNQTL